METEGRVYLQTVFIEIEEKPIKGIFGYTMVKKAARLIVFTGMPPF